jgi:hypothetical protein
MRRRAASQAVGVAAAVTIVGAVLAGSGGAASGSSRSSPAARGVVHPVSTLDPAATARQWSRLVARPQTLRAAADCRPLRGIYYAATDWLRLATKLAASASPCAQYYVSIPPFVADKTVLRSNQAWRIRALGPNFHAMAEIHYTGWSKWVASTGSSWFSAGVEARRRMAAAGFDLAKGDTWAVNEFSSAVRTGAGAARANALELVRGLYEGEGGAPVRGTVFAIGVGQAGTGVPLYQTNLQNWLTDSAFWTEMSTRVSDWSQEVYPDFRSYAVPGAPIQTRRDYLNDYLEHELVLAGAGPPTIDAARAYLQAAYSPLANAAWQWASGYGWTMVPVDQMQAFVSAQTYALRYFSATSGQPQDHWGFAWQPRNATGLSPGDFAAQTGVILDRLAAATRDSGQTVDPADPGIGACGPPGQNLWCGGDLAGAVFTEAWKSFRTWTQPVLAFTTPPQTIAAGTPSAAMALALLTSSGAPQIAASPIAVTISSSSPQGQFATDPAGPLSSTLTLTIPAGSNASPPFYYQDTRAGSPVLTAAAFGVTSGTQTESVLPGPVAGVSVRPASASVAVRGSQTFTVAGVDSFENAVPVTAAWSASPASLGPVRPTSGASTMFTAGRKGGTGTVTAAVAGPSGPLSASATVTVKPGQIKVAAIRYGIGRNALLVTVTVVDRARRPVAGAFVSILVRRDGHRYFSARRRTASNGRVTFRLRPRRGCFRTTVTKVADPGYVWRPGTPPNRFCK